MEYFIGTRAWTACRIMSRSHAQVAKTVLEDHLLLLFQHGPTDSIEQLVKMLSATSQKGDRCTIQCLLKGLESSKISVQLVCLSSLPKTTLQGDMVATRALVVYLDEMIPDQINMDSDGADTEDCTIQAFTILANIASRDDEFAMSFIMDNLFFTPHLHWDYSEGRVNMPVVDALAERGMVGDPNIIDILVPQLKTMDGYRGSSDGSRLFEVVRKLAGKGNAKLIDALLTFMPGFHCHDYNKGLVEQAYMTLKQVMDACDRASLIAADPETWKNAREVLRKYTIENSNA